LTLSLDNRGLLHSYQTLNAELDMRVAARTKELQESEEKYSALVEGSEAAIMLLRHGRFVDCNAATLRMFHCESKTAFFGFSPDVLSPEFQPNGVDSRTLSMRYVQQAIDEGSKRFDWVYKRVDGGEFKADVHLSRINIHDETLIQGIVIDISERAKAELALQESEQKYRSLIENMQDCLYRTDADGRLVFASASIQTLMACAEDEIIGDKLSDYYLDPSKRKAFIQQLLESPDHQINDFEAQVRRKDGRIIWLSANSHFIYDHKGDIAGVEGTLRDVSSIKDAEELLRKLHQAVEHAGESIMITNRHGVIEYVNPAFSQMSGYTSEEAVGMTPQLLQSGIQDKDFYQQLWKTISTGEHWSNSLIDRHKDGSLYPVLTSIAPIVGDAGDITHYVAIQRDMTALTEMEEKFNQAQKMEAIGSLVSGIAHDFNNMLAAMIGSMYMIKQKLQHEPETLQRVEALEQQSFRAADMIKQLLAFARKGNVDVQSLSFTSLMKEVFKLTRLTIPENITLQLDVCDENLEIQGDASLLQQILMNLMNNARDAVAKALEPSIHVDIDAFQADSDFVARHPDGQLKMHYARLRVRDNGCGISQSDTKKVFEPFYTTKEIGKGTGLGLAMIDGSVQSHGGFIDIQSEVGKGTLFSLYFPLQSAAHQQPMEVLSEATNTDGNGELILMVDDEASLRVVHGELLSRLGYRVLLAEDGDAASRIFAQHQDEIQLLITDVVMPHCGGVELAQRIWQQRPSMPVLFVTGYDKNQLSNIPTDQHHVQMLLKPFSIDAMAQHIHAMLQTRKRPVC